MKTFNSIVFIIILILNQAVTLYSSPAFPGLIKMKQPDGTTISVYLKGDEKVHRMESEDGYSLLYNNNRTIVYAISNQEGNMVPSSIAARDLSLRSASDQTFLKEIPKQLNYSKSQINTLKSIWVITQKSLKDNKSQLRAANGFVRTICTLIDFPEQNGVAAKSMIKTKEEFDQLMNQAGYSANGGKGSVNDYFKENSYGAINLVITVAGPYTVSKNWKYYGENGTNGQDIPARVQEFAVEAAKLTFPNVNPTDYDNDNDGYIDAFHIIYAGYGEEAGGDPNCIWAHEYGFSTLTFGGKKVMEYSCSPELQGNSGERITNIGVICHEMCHGLGALDYYDTDYEVGGQFDGTGKWDLMAAGSWNNNGISPSHVNMFQKIRFGWVTPILLNQPQAITNMPNSAENPVAYRYNTTTSGEYFILENRQKTGFDKYVPGSGLLIYRVSLTDADIRSNTINAGHPQKMYPICASASSNPTGTPASYGFINAPGCPFPGSFNKTSFTDYTIPAATSWNGSNTVKPITEIQEQDGLLSFRFMMPDAEPVTNFQANVENQNTVRLTWNKPSEDVIGYNVYRNDLLLIRLLGKNNAFYTQYNVSAGNHNYCITALYSNKESAPVCKSVQITNSPVDNSYLSVKNLTVQNVNEYKDIQLNWQSPFVNTWATIANTYYTPVYYPNINQFTAVTRFTTDNLLKFQGTSLTKVRFALKQLQCKYTVLVWLIDPTSSSVPGTPQVNQVVTNPSNTNDNFDITLNTPIPVDATKEIWIGIQYELNPMKAVAGIDYGPGVPEQNFVVIDDQWYFLNDQDDFNWYIAGYMDFGSSVLKAPEDSWLRSSNATTAIGTKYIVYRDNVQIATTTQSQYVDLLPPAGTHTYCVTIAYDDGKESEQVCIQATSTNNTDIAPVETRSGGISIYPNPIKKGESLTIHCDSNTAPTLMLYTVSGQLIQQQKISGSDFHLKMDFEPGIYLLQIKNPAETIIRRIIVR